MPDKISGDADSFQRGNPIVGIRYHGEELVAIGTENFGEITEKNKMNICNSGVSISWFRCVVGTKPRCFRYNIGVNGNVPPSRSELQSKHRIDYNPEGILNCIELPIELRSDMPTASVDTIKLEGRVAKISHERHCYFFFFFRIAYRC